MDRDKIKARIVFLTAMFFPLYFFSGQVQEESVDLHKLYAEAQFTKITDYLKARDYSRLSLGEKLLYIECMARTAQGPQIEGKMKNLLEDNPESSETTATAGMLFLSLGQTDKASESIEKAMVLDSESRKAVLAKIMLSLHLRQFQSSKEMYAKLLLLDPDGMGTYYYLLGLEVYSASRDPLSVGTLYRERAEEFKKTDKHQHNFLKSNADIYEKASQEKIFQVRGKAESLIIPFAETQRGERPNSIFLNVKDKKYRVLLDTGNAVGWTIHNSELRDALKSRKGGRAVTRLGTHTELLEGYYIHNKQVDMGGFQITGMIGLYVPKPNPEFYDANLNPAFIRDRIVTLDYPKNQLILRTKVQYERDLESQAPSNLVKLPWYGYKRVFIPIRVNGGDGFAMVETGAEDIAVKLDFSRKLGLNLKPQRRYVADGRVFQYHEAEVSVVVGKYVFKRNKAEVWPFDRFYNRFTGFTPDVIIGPQALTEKYVLSFDPFSCQVILSRG